MDVNTSSYIEQNVGLSKTKNINYFQKPTSLPVELISLPVELIKEIFQYLTFSASLFMSMTSREWNRKVREVKFLNFPIFLETKKIIDTLSPYEWVEYQTFDSLTYQACINLCAFNLTVEPKSLPIDELVSINVLSAFKERYNTEQTINYKVLSKKISAAKGEKSVIQQYWLAKSLRHLDPKISKELLEKACATIVKMSHSLVKMSHSFFHKPKRPLWFDNISFLLVKSDISDELALEIAEKIELNSTKISALTYIAKKSAKNQNDAITLLSLNEACKLMIKSGIPLENSEVDLVSVLNFLPQNKEFTKITAKIIGLRHLDVNYPYQIPLLCEYYKYYFQQKNVYEANNFGECIRGLFSKPVNAETEQHSIVQYAIKAFKTFKITNPDLAKHLFLWIAQKKVTSIKNPATRIKYLSKLIKNCLNFDPKIADEFYQLALDTFEEMTPSKFNLRVYALFLQRLHFNYFH